MPAAGIVVVASSAGGPAALIQLLASLPARFPLPIVVVQHVVRTRPSLLAAILARRTALEVHQAVDGETLLPGHVYLAPPDHHVYVDEKFRLRLSDAAPLHFLRPAADVLFESAAEQFAGSVIAVILSGSGTDGMLGAEAVRRNGGLVIAQDRESSAFFGMPGAAIDSGNVDFIVPLDEIGPRLIEMGAGATP
jgi:two-component system chemotaxis response regulator CheB